MKSMKNKTAYSQLRLGLITLMLTGLVLTMPSCDKEEDYGVPQITNVRVTDPAQANVSLTEGALGQMVVIQGNNLKSTQQVFFNNLESFVNPSLVTDNNIIVRIPGDFPTEITNTIKVVTLGGETSYDFRVDIPLPVANDFPLEYVPEGGTLVIRGLYFYNVESIEFAGDVTTTNFVVDNPQQISVSVPAGAQSGPVKVHAVAGTATSKAHFRDNRNMMVNFDDKPICWGGDAFVVNADNIPAHVPVTPISGNFYYLKQDYAAGSWWIQETVIAYCGDIAIAPPKSDWMLAFEMWVGDVWDANWFEIEMIGSSTIYYEWRGYNTLGGEAKKLSNTGWMTVKIPIADMTALSGDTFKLSRWGSYKAQNADTFEFAFDNFRFVPAN
jgi:hypothetical protein